MIMEKRIETLESLIPKLKANRKILPLKVECMEWELRALKAEQQVKNCSIPNVSVMSEHHCENELTEKELFHDHCLKCGEYISED